jgi:hypothetical protein
MFVEPVNDAIVLFVLAPGAVSSITISPTVNPFVDATTTVVPIAFEAVIVSGVLPVQNLIVLAARSLVAKADTTRTCCKGDVAKYTVAVVVPLAVSVV